MNSIKILKRLSKTHPDGIIRISDHSKSQYTIDCDEIVPGSKVTRGEALAVDMKAFRDEDLAFKATNPKDSW